MGISASNPASEKEVSYEPSISHFSGWSVACDRACVADARAVAGQSAPAEPASAAAGAPPRLADGRPDLQGIWDFGTITPLERPRSTGNEGVFYRRGGGEL